MVYYHLSEEVREQLEMETREIASGQGFFHLEPYLSLSEAYHENLQTRIDGFDHPDRTAADLRVRRELMVKGKGRLLSIKEGRERNF